MIILMYGDCVYAVVAQHKFANNGTRVGGGSSADGNDRQVVSALKTRYCRLGLLDDCLTNEQCVARRKSTVLRQRSGLCRCLPGFLRDSHTGLCSNGRQRLTAFICHSTVSK